jgi:hypothetical protein
MFAALCAVCCGLVSLSEVPADAAPMSACTTHRGTVVAVDFAHWGGPIARGCGIDAPSGYALLHAAGFTTAGDAHDGAAFICRIGNQAFDDGIPHPTPGEASCNGTPGTSAYWSYWLAPAGQNTWTYSPLGPMGDVPKPGEVELWMFGATNVGGTRGSGVPKFPPSTLRAASSAPTTGGPKPGKSPSTTATHAGSPPASRARAGHRPTATRHAATGRGQPGRPAHERATAPGSGHHAAAARSAAVAPARRTRPTIVSAKPTAEHTSSGSAGPLVVALCLALALVAGAVWTVRRRRRYA